MSLNLQFLLVSFFDLLQSFLFLLLLFLTGYHLLVLSSIEKQLQTPQTAEQVKSQSHKINA